MLTCPAPAVTATCCHTFGASGTSSLFAVALLFLTVTTRLPLSAAMVNPFAPASRERILPLAGAGPGLIHALHVMPPPAVQFREGFSAMAMVVPAAITALLPLFPTSFCGTTLSPLLPLAVPSAGAVPLSLKLQESTVAASNVCFASSAFTAFGPVLP